MTTMLSPYTNRTLAVDALSRELSLYSNKQELSSYRNRKELSQYTNKQELSPYRNRKELSLHKNKNELTEYDMIHNASLKSKLYSEKIIKIHRRRIQLQDELLQQLDLQKYDFKKPEVFVLPSPKKEKGFKIPRVFDLRRKSKNSIALQKYKEKYEEPAVDYLLSIPSNINASNMIKPPIDTEPPIDYYKNPLFREEVSIIGTASHLDEGSILSKNDNVADINNFEDVMSIGEDIPYVGLYQLTNEQIEHFIRDEMKNVNEEICNMKDTTSVVYDKLKELQVIIEAEKNSLGKELEESRHAFAAYKNVVESETSALSKELEESKRVLDIYKSYIDEKLSKFEQEPEVKVLTEEKVELEEVIANEMIESENNFNDIIETEAAAIDDTTGSVTGGDLSDANEETSLENKIEKSYAIKMKIESSIKDEMSSVNEEMRIIKETSATIYEKLRVLQDTLDTEKKPGGNDMKALFSVLSDYKIALANEKITMSKELKESQSTMTEYKAYIENKLTELHNSTPSQSESIIEKPSEPSKYTEKKDSTSKVHYEQETCIKDQISEAIENNELITEQMNQLYIMEIQYENNIYFKRIIRDLIEGLRPDNELMNILTSYSDLGYKFFILPTKRQKNIAKYGYNSETGQLLIVSDYDIEESDNDLMDTMSEFSCKADPEYDQECNKIESYEIIQLKCPNKYFEKMLVDLIKSLQKIKLTPPAMEKLIENGFKLYEPNVLEDDVILPKLKMYAFNKKNKAFMLILSKDENQGEVIDDLKKKKHLFIKKKAKFIEVEYLSSIIDLKDLYIESAGYDVNLQGLLDQGYQLYSAEKYDNLCVEASDIVSVEHKAIYAKDMINNLLFLVSEFEHIFVTKEERKVPARMLTKEVLDQLWGISI